MYIAPMIVEWKDCYWKYGNMFAFTTTNSITSFVLITGYLRKPWRTVRKLNLNTFITHIVYDHPAPWVVILLCIRKLLEGMVSFSLAYIWYEVNFLILTRICSYVRRSVLSPPVQQFYDICNHGRCITIVDLVRRGRNVCVANLNKFFLPFPPSLPPSLPHQKAVWCIQQYTDMKWLLMLE